MCLTHQNPMFRAKTENKREPSLSPFDDCDNMNEQPAEIERGWEKTPRARNHALIFPDTAILNSSKPRAPSTSAATALLLSENRKIEPEETGHKHTNLTTCTLWVIISVLDVVAGGRCAAWKCARSKHMWVASVEVWVFVASKSKGCPSPRRRGGWWEGLRKRLLIVVRHAITASAVWVTVDNDARSFVVPEAKLWSKLVFPAKLCGLATVSREWVHYRFTIKRCRGSVECSVDVPWWTTNSQ